MSNLILVFVKAIGEKNIYLKGLKEPESLIHGFYKFLFIIKQFKCICKFCFKMYCLLPGSYRP